MKEKRIYPYGELANRTIGFLRDSASWNLGLEKAYDSVLRGRSGIRMMRSVAGGTFVPVDDDDIMPEDGKDIITTLNVKIQDISQNALKDMLIKNKAEWGTCVVMEVSTGKIKAIANMTKTKDSFYIENFNYAIKRYDPGSTFKLVGMLALLEDGFINIEDQVDLNGGEYVFGKNNDKDLVMRDSEKHKEKYATIEKAFALSSNVGVSRLVDKYYKKNPLNFIKYIKKLNLHKKTNFDLMTEEVSPLIPSPKTPMWSPITSLPWMSVGYGIEITPLQTLMFYNAVANNGKMVKPYLVSKILDHGFPVFEKETIVTNSSICSANTLEKLKKLLKSVVDSGTAKSVFKNTNYAVAGKTGTAKWLTKKGYSDSIYVSSFAGYFPADNPLYSCVVMIKNKPNAVNYYGASVAAPVFREIADRIMALKDNLNHDIVWVEKEKTTTKKTRHPSVHFAIHVKNKNNIYVPNVIGMSLSQAVLELEKYGLKFQIVGEGKVVAQSVNPNNLIQINETIILNLE